MNGSQNLQRQMKNFAGYVLSKANFFSSFTIYLMIRFNILDFNSVKIDEKNLFDVFVNLFQEKDAI